MNYLSTASGIFLVSFRGQSEQFIFNSDIAVFADLIILHGNHGIVYVKRFQISKSKFVKMSKSEIINSFSWDTHTTEQLKKINFIKK